MSDLVFGWFLGLMNIIVPYLLIMVWRLKKQVRFLTSDMSVKPRRKGLFGGLFNKAKDIVTEE